MTITKVSDVSFPAATVGYRRNTYSPNSAEVRLAAVMTCQRRRTGSSVPHHKQKIAAGQNACSNLSATWDTLDYVRVPMTRVRAAGPGGLWGECMSAGDVAIKSTIHTAQFRGPTVSTTFADNLARASFYKQLSALRTKVQGLTFLGELKETVGMLKSPLKGINRRMFDYYGNCKKLDLRRKGSRRDLSSLWLEVAFGWKPLLNDIHDIITAYRQLTNPVHQDRVRGFGKKEYDNTSILFSEAGGQSAFFAQRLVQNGCWWYTTDGRLKEEHVVRYTGAVRPQVRATQWDNWALFGFEPEQFVPTAWELLPWSFLIDYFTNIGDILSASVTSTANVVYVNRTVVTKVSVYRAFKMDHVKSATSFGGGWYPVWWDSRECWSRSTRKTVTRTASTGISMPSFQFSLDLNDGQLANIAALLGQFNGLHPQHQPIKHFKPHRGFPG